mmetsp:Transcript_46928/g.75623  ORF Transcript_46928/g.75623 Transcript_46928/m.75623 type:complete len:333 (+) Transcript_46928:103-1101(+)
MEPLVVVVGSCNYDQIVYVPDFPAAGATIYGGSYATGFGGKGANQCVMAAKLGVATAMVGALGSDQIERITRENFTALGVDTQHLCAKDGAASGVAQICVSAADGNNNIVIVPGANLLFSPDDVTEASEMISKSRVLLLQNEVPAATSLAAMRAARSASAPGPLVILNAAPAPSLGDTWQEGQWNASTRTQMLSSCDILCVNETEAEVLSGMAVKGGSSEEDLLQAVLAAGAKLQEMGASQVLITLGVRGSCLIKKDGCHIRVPGPAFRVDALDSSGAGDAYLGALAAYLSTSHPIEEALVLAGKVATMTVQAKGTQSSFPSLSSLPSDFHP